MAEKSDAANTERLIDIDNDPDIIVGKPERTDAIVRDAIDPASAGSGSGSASGSASGSGKKRGRKPGSKNGTKTPKVDLSGLEQIAFSAHAMLAAIVHTPELEIDEEEAAKLAKCSTEVSKHYVNLEASEKTVAWINLALCMGQIYGPRVIAIRIRKSQSRTSRDAHSTQTTEAQGSKEVKPENVILMPGAFAAPPEKGSVG